MSLKPTMMYYPVESINSRSRAEKRWEDDANVYDDISGKWQISLGNGKRLGRKWRRKGGIAFVPTRYGHITVYNECYDVALNEAKKAQYDMSFQPDGDPDFYGSTNNRN